MRTLNFLLTITFVILFLCSCSKSKDATFRPTQPMVDTSTLLKSTKGYGYTASGTLSDSSDTRWEYDNQRRPTTIVSHIELFQYPEKDYDSSVFIYSANNTETKNYHFKNGSLNDSHDNIAFLDSHGNPDSVFSVDQNAIVNRYENFYDESGHDTLVNMYDVSGSYKTLSQTLQRYYTGNRLDSFFQTYINIYTIKEYWNAGNLVSVKFYTFDNNLANSYTMTYSDSSNASYTNLEGNTNLLATSTYTNYPPNIPGSTYNVMSYSFDDVNRLSSMSSTTDGTLTSKTIYTYY